MTRAYSSLRLAFSCLLLVGATSHSHAVENEVEIVDGDPVSKVLINGKTFTQVIAGDVKDYPTFAKPFLYPVIGPTGANMTRNFPMVEGIDGESKDHPHHQSLWFAHGAVSGADFWHSKNGKEMILPVISSVTEKGDQSKGYLTHWLLKAKPIAKASVDYRFDVLGDGSRVIDYETSIQPVKDQSELTFGDTKEGTMAIRLAPQLRLRGKVATGKAINSEGVTGKAVWGKRAEWVAYWGIIDGKTCGVAIFDHPTNLRHPTWWHARDYGLVAANPFGISDFERKPKGTGDYTLKQGETLSLRYRFVFFAGTAEEAKIAEKYDRWVKETTTKKKEQ